ncbi:MAG: site-specific tyrosine recombinase XerC [Candidatus Dormibacteria bacterium]
MASSPRRRRPVVGDPVDLRGMHRAISEFCEWMRMTNYAERTAETRQVYLTWFAAWLEERGITRPAEVTKPILERYQRSLYHHRKVDGRPLSFGFQYAQLVALRTFFRWAARTNRILYNPASELELPRLEHRLPQYVLSAPEVETVLSTADVGSPLGLRDRAMMEVLYSTGMRRMELIGLHLVDLDGERGTIRIRQGKGHKDRMVPVGERAVAWCDRYLAEVRPSYVVEPDEGTLFLSAEGGAFTPNRMSALVRGYVDRAQLGGKRGSCHLFRHSCATLMLEGGADIRYIQQLLGHADLSTTQIYTQVSIRRLQQVHAATHPSAVLARRRPVAELDGAGESDVEQLLLTLAAEAAEEDGEGRKRTPVPEVHRVRSPQTGRTEGRAWSWGEGDGGEGRRPETMRREAVR